MSQRTAEFYAERERDNAKIGQGIFMTPDYPSENKKLKEKLKDKETIINLQEKLIRYLEREVGEVNSQVG